MQRRNLLVIGGCVLAAMFLILWLYRSESSSSDSADLSHLERPDATGRRLADGTGLSATEPSLEAGSGGLPPEQQRFSLEEAQAYTQAIQESTSQFVADSMPRLEACLGPASGPRQPHNVLITFKREPAGAERSELAAAVIQPLPPSGGANPIDERTLRCLQDLKGLPFDLNPEAGPAASELQRVITLVLPTHPGQ